MKCPHCQGELVGLKPAYNRAHDLRCLELGQCVDCGADKTEKEVAAGNWRCRRCRQKRAGKMNLKRGALSDFTGSYRLKPVAHKAFR